MKNIFNQFINNHQQAIGYMANLLALGSAAFALYSWLVMHTNGWVVAGIAWLACALLGLRIYIQSQRIAQLNGALDTSVETNIMLMKTSLLNSLEIMQETGEVPITETAALLQTLKTVNEKLGKGDDAQNGFDEAFALLAEYERRVRK